MDFHEVFEQAEPEIAKRLNFYTSFDERHDVPAFGVESKRTGLRNAIRFNTCKPGQAMHLAVPLLVDWFLEAEAEGRA